MRAFCKVVKRSSEGGGGSSSRKKYDRIVRKVVRGDMSSFGKSMTKVGLINDICYMIYS